MAKEVITKCDKCGLAGEDVKTYRVGQDGHTWEVDLDDKHAKTVNIAEAMKIGRQVEVASRRVQDNRALESRIRNLPQSPEKE